MAEAESQPANGAATNTNASTSNDPPATQAEYKKSQQRTRELIRKKAQMETRLSSIEDTIAQKELVYLENTQSGNIIMGFDNYMKGQAGAAAQRRKAGSMDQNRVFSRSSISYKLNQNGDTATSLAAASNTPTPLSASFRDSGSAHPTPTSTSGNKNIGRNRKKSLAGIDVEDSETDLQANRKRTNFGAPKK